MSQTVGPSATERAAADLLEAADRTAEVAALMHGASERFQEAGRPVDAQAAAGLSLLLSALSDGMRKLPEDLGISV